MCDYVHSTLTTSHTYVNMGTKIPKLEPTPFNFNPNPSSLSSRTIMGMSCKDGSFTNLGRYPRIKGVNFMHHYQFGPILCNFGSNGFDFSSELNLADENELGLEFMKESGTDDNMSLKRDERDESGEFGALDFDDPLEEKVKSRVSKGSVEGNELEFGTMRGQSEFEREKFESDKFGVLDFDEPLEGKAKRRVLKGEDLMGFEGDESGDVLGLEMEDERGEELVQEKGKKKGKLGVKSRKQLIKRSNLLAKQVIGVQSALSLGFLSQLWVDTASLVIREVEVRPSLLSSESGNILLEDIKQVGDVVLVQDETFVFNELRTVGLETLVGYSVVTPRRRNLGKVRGYTFNINSGVVESLELDAFGCSLIPSSLVSTYALFTEDVLQVVSDTIIVHESAATGIQRLTKGLLGTKDLEASNFEYPERGEESTRPVRSRKSRKKFSKRKSNARTKDFNDDLEFPMDYM